MITDTMVVDVSRDWAIACDVQERFMQPSEAGIANLDYSAKCRQMRALGGDCYDFIDLGDRRLAFFVADASGKSVAAVLMAANVQSSLRTAALFTKDAAAVIRAVNRQLYAASLSDRYATVFYGVIDATTRTLRYVNAGHNPPLIIHRDGSITWLECGGAPVGIFQDSGYTEGVVQLCEGDAIVAYTDGVVESTSAAGEEWGTGGLYASVAEIDRPAAHSVDAIFESMDEFSGGQQSDDATAVVLKFL